MITFSSLIGDFISLIWAFIPVIMGLALLLFIWGVAKFIYKVGDEKEREKGKLLMFWGLIAIFVMVSITGILYFMYGELGFTNPFSFPPQLPESGSIVI